MNISYAKQRILWNEHQRIDVSDVESQEKLVLLAKRSIYDRKPLFAKGSRKSDELNGFFSYFS